MKRSVSKCLAVLLVFLCTLASGYSAEPAEYPAYDYRVERYRSGWNCLVPRYITLQTGGLMGAVSVGSGSTYDTEHCETACVLRLNSNFRHAPARHPFTPISN